MKLIGVGIDIVSISIFRKKLAPGLIEELFLPGESEYCSSRARPWESYAARFAAKEAVFKALGAGLSQGLRWKDVEIVKEDSGRVHVRLTGAALKRAGKIGVTMVEISMSHSGENAIAVATAIG